MAFKYLGVKPPKVQHPTATELTEQLEHFQGALLETREYNKQTMKLVLNAKTDRQAINIQYERSVMLDKLLRVSAGETK